MIYLGTDRPQTTVYNFLFSYVCTAFTARIGNEVSVGQAIRESGIARSEVYVTTKLA